MKKIIAVISVIVLATAVFFFFQKKISKKIFRKKAVVQSNDTSNIYYKQIYNRLDTYFTNRSIKSGFSGSVLISVRGNPVYEKCFGYCDYRNKDLLSDTNSFQLASVSKTFTATAVLWCIEQGLLSLEDSLQKFFPQLPYRGIRVKDLLCHRSGLANYLYFCSGKCGKKEYLTNQQVLDIMTKQKPSMYALPNRKFEYCNTNYLLLASIVESVSHKRFKEFMHETFFEPLGMAHTFVYDYADSTDRKIAISYNSKWQIQYDDCFDGVVGDKGIYSTVHDMFLWDKAFYEGRLLSQEMMKEAYAPRSFERPGKRNYGYGWRLMQQADSSYLVYHNGWWHGNNTVFYRNIQDTTSIIILSNKFNRSVYKIQPVFDILYGRRSDSAGFEDE
ncbi:MAG: serine hydrolase domain-containing protein [Bacteroidota bacterium]